MHCIGLNLQALFYQKMDNAIHCINHYPVDKTVLGKPIVLSGGQRFIRWTVSSTFPPYEQQEPDLKFKLLGNHTFTFICIYTEGFCGNITSLQYTKNNKFLKAKQNNALPFEQVHMTQKIVVHDKLLPSQKAKPGTKTFLSLGNCSDSQVGRFQTNLSKFPTL